MTRYQIRKRHKYLCKGKLSYKTEPEALEALIDKMLNPNTYLPEQLTIYFCLACEQLHIGHEPRWKNDGHREKDNSGRGEELKKAALEVAWARGAKLDRSLRGS